MSTRVFFFLYNRYKRIPIERLFFLYNSYHNGYEHKPIYHFSSYIIALISPLKKADVA
nr:MAG TPA: hypothetical protein [Caudoviricetes sp.]